MAARRIALTAVLVILLGLAGALAGRFIDPPAAEAQEKPKAPLNIAVVDIPQVYAEYGEAKRQMAELSKRFARVRTDLDKRRSSLDATKKELAKYKPNHPTFIKKRTDLLEQYEILKGEYYWAKEEEQVEVRKLTERLIAKIMAEVEKYGKANGYDLILQKSPIRTKSSTLEQLDRKVRAHFVLYSSSSIDLTRPILARLNR